MFGFERKKANASRNEIVGQLEEIAKKLEKVNNKEDIDSDFFDLRDILGNQKRYSRSWKIIDEEMNEKLKELSDKYATSSDGKYAYVKVISHYHGNLNKLIEVRHDERKPFIKPSDDENTQFNSKTMEFYEIDHKNIAKLIEQKEKDNIKTNNERVRKEKIDYFNNKLSEISKKNKEHTEQENRLTSALKITTDDLEKIQYNDELEILKQEKIANYDLFVDISGEIRIEAGKGIIDEKTEVRALLTKNAISYDEFNNAATEYESSKREIKDKRQKIYGMLDNMNSKNSQAVNINVAKDTVSQPQNLPYALPNVNNVNAKTENIDENIEEENTSN